MTTKFVGVKEFRQNMAKLYQKAKKDKQRLIILNKNKPVFELRPLDDKDASLEKLVYDVKNALEEMKQGLIYSHQDIKTIFGLK
ncbi:hypothetical protein A2533_04815 [Candidatus Falkowbacteria bacterium RIFOXYD2_FULL_35_9]|uniref:Antitoxin n=1 Tax=Candidatus Falkowbacteria bacterium RIFOXYC2_FULL_36_12 TaxID=1798002 RepID=A0A1F5SYY0_9BACT|nr:MAG: hypothetical protein A2478_04380 [Candidatus Falkowbacteria bacterium RIFOXYC2_FULL_36_12]OGF33178.1 MAG: hypothetical protein A2223_04915 [Candidatus Falkowbacteria bacterium RIFOXYA2_FULL_35_8]OGF46176.1 MAG: hypothetical protein A2533_04815 [Candidatus Falkowbacteria bacterium RIFOXYD2_FULL_35_9]